MVDATILLPTYRHVAFLPYAVESALDQEGASIELFVVGDGVEDATREIVSRYEPRHGPGPNPAIHSGNGGVGRQAPLTGGGAVASLTMPRVLG